MDVSISTTPSRQPIGCRLYGGSRLLHDTTVDDNDHEYHVAFGVLLDDCADCHPERDVLRWFGHARGVDEGRRVRGGWVDRLRRSRLSRFARDQLDELVRERRRR